MSINIDQNTVRASIVAAKQYSTTVAEGDNRHRANILVHENGRDYCAGIRFVCVTISEDLAEVIIEDFHTIYGDRSNWFTSQDSVWSFDGRLLHIQATDAFNNILSVSVAKI